MTILEVEQRRSYTSGPENKKTNDSKRETESLLIAAQNNA